MRRGFKIVIAVVVAALGVNMVAAHAEAAAGSVLFAVTPPAGTSLVTNEYAFWNPSVSSAVLSKDWEMNSGSLFTHDTDAGPAYWSGKVDDISPDAKSVKGTNSSIFRMTTKRADFKDTETRVKLKIDSQTQTKATPVTDWDGVHIFLRYQSEESLYYASIARRDGSVVIKKKCPGGPSNGGTYYTLGSKSGFKISMGQWRWYAADVQTNTDGSVTLGISRVGTKIFTITDKGTGCAPITGAGKTGLRGDNSDFSFQGFRVTTLN